MKKIKKLVLNKSVVSNLNSPEMNVIRGGYNTEGICGPTLDLICLTGSLDPACLSQLTCECNTNQTCGCGGDETLSPQGCWTVPVWTACGFC